MHWFLHFRKRNALATFRFLQTKAHSIAGA